MPIFDQGYQHWQGNLAGHGWRWLAIARHGIRVGRKGLFVRLVLLGALGPALALAGVISLWGLVEQKADWAVAILRNIGFRDLVETPADYRLTAWTLCFHFFLMIEIFIIMILVMLIGPSLISQDMRYNAFPLYFSRPVRRIDYFLGKLGVIGFFLGMVAVVPAVLAWTLGLMFSLNFSVVWDTSRLLLGVVLYGGIVVLSAGLFMLALSSLSRNSRYIAVFWAGMWFISSIVAGIMHEVHQESMRRDWYRLQDQFYRKQNEMHNIMWQRNNDVIFEGPGGEFFPHLKPDELEKFQQEEKKRRKEEIQRREFEKKRRDDEVARLTKEMKEIEEAIEKHHEEVEERLRQDWRPVISYPANLQRIGYALIGSQEAWEKLDELTGIRRKKNLEKNQEMNQLHQPHPRALMRRQGLAVQMVPQYPWQWSAFVLLALGGLSIWILNSRVKSLDRLR